MFINFDKPHAATNEGDAERGVVKNFASPMSRLDYVNADYNFDKELQWQLQIGSKLFPEYPCKSNAETYYQLKKALGIHGSAFHSISIRPFEFFNDKFMIGVDTEKILEAGFTGLNTRAGDLMVLKGRSANGDGIASNWADSCFIILHTDQILEIRDAGVQVFD